ncbi:DUF998 domain-containing protein [Actinokineospora auranticolor]|uniref:Uncharacterized protein DUF998 n=1 Tax=Actinokineospora auranticolor TaxID=155976 RepID=A0A2S6H038_9PSEU|nr:DUF998 domain-containing protein [Actinokineospora auranticolor]PPK70845.1 uncharacterized protein DUF998 [Actinokineospora auranticolor]
MRAGALGVVGLLAGVGTLLLLHVIPPTDAISPTTRTLSEYAMGDNKWLFDLAVLLVAGGSVAAFTELARARVARPAALVFGAVWVLGLVAVVAFTKTNWAVGPSVGGYVHRYASVAAFLALPIAVLIASGRVVSPFPRWTARGLGIVSLLWFGTIVVGVVNMAGGGEPWWRFVPLGLVERVIAGSAVAALVVLLTGVVTGPSRPQRVSATGVTSDVRPAIGSS